MVALCLFQKLLIREKASDFDWGIDSWTFKNPGFLQMQLLRRGNGCKMQNGILNYVSWIKTYCKHNAWIFLHCNLTHIEKIIHIMYDAWRFYNISDWKKQKLWMNVFCECRKIHALLLLGYFSRLCSAKKCKHHKCCGIFFNVCQIAMKKNSSVVAICFYSVHVIQHAISEHLKLPLAEIESGSL